MQRFFTLHLPLIYALAISCTQVFAQERLPRTTALTYLQEHTQQLGLTPADVSDLAISGEYLTKHNGVTHVWIQQQYKGIPVFNGLIGLHVLPNGEVVQLGHRFVANLDQKINTTLPALSAAQALQIVLQDIGLSQSDVPRLLQKISETNYVFDAGEIARMPIPVYACYVHTQEGTVHLSWAVEIDQATSSDYWNIRIDALTGAVLAKNNRTQHCNPGHLHAPGETCEGETNQQATAAAPILSAAEINATGSYNVFAFPTESPSHGSRELILNPADLTASPFEWHDVNGLAGAEYTYTRGNNVWAYTDLVNDNNGTIPESAEGGTGLLFDFPFDANAEPNVNINAAVTNLFYVNNRMHDITYLYGFDEPAGNFQMNNYGKGGLGNDAVRAEALDGSGVDNATFTTPRDSLPPRMQMFKFSLSGGNFVQINAPAEIIGELYGQSATFGGAITSTPLTADVIVYDDGSGGPPEACNPPNNNLVGKIVMTDRGTCDFSEKALNVQQAGGVACIICNYSDNTSPLGPGAFGGQVTIPTLMLSRGDCDAIKQYINQGLNLTLVQPPSSGPNFLDGDFDNGIISHEYTHGISNRLTGGPQQVDCLENGEQMGEGWSDFFAMMMTRRPNDVATTNRGIATYVLRQPNNGTGVRRYPYNTDMTVSPVTYGTVAEKTGVHAVGEVWAAMLWDLYWAMVDEYGFDSNWSNKESGNARTLQLVIDGMKLQPCYPGFKDGRDAILAADKLNYDGADTCLISKVFARRGLGIGANQGSFTTASDGKENFDPIPTCITELKIRKTTPTPTLDPGGIAAFSIIVTNHKGTPATGVIVTDELPDGLEFISATEGGQLIGNTVTWDLGTLANGQVKNLQYAAKANKNGSISLVRDQMENEDDWNTLQLNSDNYFFLQNTDVVTGTQAWKGIALAKATDFTLLKETPLAVTGTRPYLRFWNKYKTELGADAGFLEFKPANNPSAAWVRLKLEDGLRNGYPGAVSYSTIAIPFLKGFSGNSGGWVQSYLDMSQFSGDSINMRFRFVTNPTIASDGWLFDDVELLDLVSFEGEACVTSAEGDQACAKAPGGGVILNPGTVSTNEPNTANQVFQLQPNPASTLVYVSALQAVHANANLTVVAADGRIVARQLLPALDAGQSFPLDIHRIASGLYWVRIEHNDGTQVLKVVIR